jgi:hypothetical protein
MKVYEIKGIRKVFPDDVTDEEVAQFFMNAAKLVTMRDKVKIHYKKRPSRIVKGYKSEK